MSIELTGDHGFVLAALLGSAFVHSFWMSFKVGGARKKYGVKYPLCYAPAGHKHENEFNCVQRAHQNSLENLPTFLSLLCAAGIRYPISASVAGGIYLLGRVLYFQGYSTGSPAGRYRGAIGYLGTLGLMGMVGRWAVTLLMPLLK